MNPGRFLSRSFRIGIVLASLAAGTHPGRAGNPIFVHSAGGPVTWESGVVPFHTDLGPLGVLDNASATQTVRDGFAAWAAIPTVNLTIADRGPILLGGVAVDVDAVNWPGVLFVRDGQSPVVFDHDGQIFAALGIGQFAGFSLGEFLTPDLRHWEERLILLNGPAVDGDGPFTPVSWQGLVNHEEGHHLGLQHSNVNGQAFFFGDPILGQAGPPPADSIETMYPFLQIGNDFQASPHRDDSSILSVLYPSPDFASTTGAIRGRIVDANLATPLRGVNVTARSLSDPFHEAVSNISGGFDFFFDATPPVSGDFSLDGLPGGGAGYSVAISGLRTVGSGFTPAPLSPLPGPEEFFNGAGESNDPDHDVPTDLVAVVPAAGAPVEGVDIFINSAAAIRILEDPDAADPPDDAAVSGFGVPPEIDIRRVEARFEDTDEDGGQDTLFVDLDAVGPVGALTSAFRFEVDFGEPRRVRQDLLSLVDQTVEPGTRGFPTADVALEVAFTHGGPAFSGLPGLAGSSHVDFAANRIHFVASVVELFAAASQEQIGAANNLDGTFTILGFASSQWRHDFDRAPDTDDNGNPSIVQETSRFTFFPFPIVPTHLGSVPNGTLIAVEDAIARAIRIGNIGANSFSDLALSPDGRLFGSLGNTASGRIVEIDPDTAERVDVGLSGYEAVPALDFGPPGTAFAGILFGVGRRTDAGGNVADFLIRIDPATGAGTPVGGPIGIPFVDGIVFRDDGSLFGVGYVNGGVLLRIHPVTGAGTPVGPIGFESVVGLEVGTDGLLIGSLGGIDPQAGSLIRIDPLTGAGALIGATGFSPVSGLTRLP